MKILSNGQIHSIDKSGYLTEIDYFARYEEYINCKFNKQFRLAVLTDILGYVGIIAALSHITSFIPIYALATGIYFLFRMLAEVTLESADVGWNYRNTLCSIADMHSCITSDSNKDSPVATLDYVDSSYGKVPNCTWRMVAVLTGYIDSYIPTMLRYDLTKTTVKMTR